MSAGHDEVENNIRAIKSNQIEFEGKNYGHARQTVQGSQQ
jgi:hypothetical protein